MVGAHASFTLSPETLAACADLARSAEAGVHIHVAEDAVDEADAVHRYGRRVVQRLAGSGVLGESTLLAHAVHLDASEIELAAAAGVTFAHNPRSNMHNAVGRAPIGLLGRRVGLGTDGIGADLFEESRVAWLRRKEEAPTTPVDWPLARLAVGSGWAGRVFDERLLGRLEVGAPADLVVLDYRPPTPIEPSNLGGHWVFGLSAAAVRHVVVAGELVVRDRRLTRVDEEGLMASAAREATGLWRRMDEIGPHPFTPSVVLPVPIGAPSDG
jgi:cytosine/adenosine deaminase-related metal-dependent hydrolase